MVYTRVFCEIKVFIYRSKLFPTEQYPTSASFVAICQPPSAKNSISHFTLDHVRFTSWIRLFLSLLPQSAPRIVQMWFSVDAYGEHDPRSPLTGAEEGLAALWRFDEGRGTVAVDSASWRRRGTTTFGTVSPAVALDPTVFSVIDKGEEHIIGDTGFKRSGSPLSTWAVSTAPVGSLARCHDGRSLYLRFNGSDANARPLQAVLTRVPAGGSLSVAAPIGESTSYARSAHATLGIGERIPVGTRLFYQPNTGAHDPWLKDSPGDYEGTSPWMAEESPYDWLAYRVVTEDGETSTNEATVALSVRPDRSAVHLEWSKKVSE